MNVQDRFQITDPICGLVETAGTRTGALLLARIHSVRFRCPGVQVYDVMARRRSVNTWDPAGRPLASCVKPQYGEIITDTHDLLTKAKARIAEPGAWWQGQLATGRICAYSALSQECAGDHKILKAALTALTAAIEAKGALPKHPLKLPGSVVVCWNDTEGRTLEEVLATFDEARRICSSIQTPAP